MNIRKRLLAGACLSAALSLASCAGAGRDSGTAGAAAGAAATPAAPATGTAAAATGVEKVKPAPGTGNVQGKVLYNGKPAEKIEVKLCETFSRFLSGCQGKTYTALTDAGGEYVITGVEPKVYQGLLARVFETESYVFATTGITGLSSAAYEVAADRTLFVQPTHLFKSDLKLLGPKAGSKVSGQGLELKWEPYPDAAYYKLGLYPEEPGVTSPYVKHRVEATSFAADKPVQKGGYRLQVEAFNGADQKLSETAGDIKITVTDGP